MDQQTPTAIGLICFFLIGGVVYFATIYFGPNMRTIGATNRTDAGLRWQTDQMLDEVWDPTGRPAMQPPKEPSPWLAVFPADCAGADFSLVRSRGDRFRPAITLKPKDISGSPAGAL